MRLGRSSAPSAGRHSPKRARRAPRPSRPEPSSAPSAERSPLHRLPERRRLSVRPRDRSRLPSAGWSPSSSPTSSGSRRCRRRATPRRCGSSSPATSTPARRLIELYGGTVEKFIGDAVMAVWGTPVATEDDAERAVRAALDLVAAVSALGDEVGAPELRARAGVLTGEAAVTLGASGQGMVAGDLVNTASRVQSAAEPGTVYVGESTRRTTEQTIVFEDMGLFELKGKEGLTPLWKALRVVSGVRGTLKSTGLEAPFVGRDRELRQIKDLFHTSADERKAHLVSVTGIAGIGKSRLAWEFYKYFDGISQTVYWHRGRCLAYGEGVAYWALADMVRMRCRIVEDEEAGLGSEEAAGDARGAHTRRRRARVRRAAARPAPRARRPRGTRPAGPVRRLAPVLRAARRCLSDGARVRGHAVGRLEPARLRRVPARVVAQPPALRDHARTPRTARPPPHLGRGPPELQLDLPRAAPGRRRWRSCWAASSPACLRACATRSSPVRRGCRSTPSRPCACCSTAVLLVQEGSVYRPVGEIESLEVPETLHALIAARLDGLSAEERRLLQDGAVLGKTFTPGGRRVRSPVAARPRSSPLLGSLVRKEVLVAPDRPALARARPVRLPPGSRPPRRLRDALEARTPHAAPRCGRLPRGAASSEDEVAEVVASHYVAAYEAAPDADDAAEIREKAREALARAGERAASLGRRRRGTALLRAGRGARRRARPSRPPCSTAPGRWHGKANEPAGARALLERAHTLYEDVWRYPARRARLRPAGRDRLHRRTLAAGGRSARACARDPLRRGARRERRRGGGSARAVPRPERRLGKGHATPRACARARRGARPARDARAGTVEQGNPVHEERPAHRASHPPRRRARDRTRARPALGGVTRVQQPARRPRRR